MAEQIILYDIPSQQGTAWSPNPWKTRLLLNYKNIPYTTEWIAYPDIATLLKSFGLPSAADAQNSTEEYTIPALRTKDGKHIMDSEDIATYLDEQYPNPPLPLSLPEDAELKKFFVGMVGPSRGLWMPLVPKNVLLPKCAEYFTRTREEIYCGGISLEEYRENQDYEEIWANMLPGIKGLGGVLKREEGPFIKGTEVSYWDFKIVGYLHFLNRVHKPFHDKLIGFEPALGRLYEASTKWLERGA